MFGLYFRLVDILLQEGTGNLFNTAGSNGNGTIICKCNSPAQDSRRNFIFIYFPSPHGQHPLLGTLAKYGQMKSIVAVAKYW